MAGDAVDVTHRGDAQGSSLRMDATSGPVGLEVDFQYRDRPPMPPPMREKRGGYREKVRTPAPVGDGAPVCSDNRLLGVMANFFGYGDVAFRCGETTGN